MHISKFSPFGMRILKKKRQTHRFSFQAAAPIYKFTLRNSYLVSFCMLVCGLKPPAIPRMREGTVFTGVCPSIWGSGYPWTGQRYLALPTRQDKGTPRQDRGTSPLPSPTEDKGTPSFPLPKTTQG